MKNSFPLTGFRAIKYKVKLAIISCFLNSVAPIVKGYIINKRHFAPQVIVKFQGGLGNQMWQYAWGVGIEKESGLPVKYDLSWYKKAPLDRKFLLTSIFPSIKIEEASEQSTRMYRRYFRYPSSIDYAFSDTFFSSKEPRYLGEYYHNARYYDSQPEELKERFVFDVSLSVKNKMILREIISSKNAVAIQVRRGDYIGSDFEVTSAKYFNGAIESMQNLQNNMHFFVFSDDITWCKETMDIKRKNLTFVEGNQSSPGVDMFLMSNCSHFIISNSSFGW